jgi:serine/threonine protein kinase
MPEPEDLQQRTQAIYRGRSVWIEWKEVSAGSAIRPDDVQTQWRIGLLADLLCSVKPDGFRAAPCLGYVKTADGGDATRFGVMFKGPSTTQSKITTLRELLGQTPKPSLSARVALSAALARCIHSLHSVNWLHKALRADNVIFCSSSSSSNLDTSFVSGFELSRPSIMDQWTEKPGPEPARDIYRHPNAQSSQTDGSYRKSYDIYSLGVVMTEIALSKPIEDVVGLENLRKAKPSTLRGIQLRLLQDPLTGNASDAESCLQQIASACGDSLRDIVERCLEMDVKPKPESDTVLELVEKLEYIAEAI